MMQRHENDWKRKAQMQLGATLLRNRCAGKGRDWRGYESRLTLPAQPRHARACRGHPRRDIATLEEKSGDARLIFPHREPSLAWMAATSAAMTLGSALLVNPNSGPRGRHFMNLTAARMRPSIAMTAAKRPTGDVRVKILSAMVFDLGLEPQLGLCADRPSSPQSCATPRPAHPPEREPACHRSRPLSACRYRRTDRR